MRVLTTVLELVGFVGALAVIGWFSLPAAALVFFLSLIVVGFLLGGDE